MATVDLHVHSIYSEPPSNWLMQTARVRESYTQISHVYREARANGMTFVTITDHNRIDGVLRLKEQHPDTVFTGLEATSQFPEDGCRVHILVYGLTEIEFSEIDKLRSDIYQLRDYLRTRDLAHSVAHATYSVNGKLSLYHLERLILLFDTFEIVNGGRGATDNRTWEQALRNLTPRETDALVRRHRIEPYSATPWIKGFTGGSDDHAGLFVGRTWTAADASDPEGFLRAVRAKTSRAEGRHNDYRSLAYTVGKTVVDHLHFQRHRARHSFPCKVLRAVVENRPLPLDIRLSLGVAAAGGRLSGGASGSALARLAGDLGRTARTRDERLDAAYESLAEFCDWAVVGLAESLGSRAKGWTEKGSKEPSLLLELKSLLPAAVMAAPFMGTLSYMHKHRSIVAQTAQRFCPHADRRPRRILCFVDALGGDDIARARRRILSRIEGDIWLATSLATTSPLIDTPPCLLNLPPIACLRMVSDPDQGIGIPSPIRSLEQIIELDPDEVYVATPGLMGLFGLLVSKLMGLRCTGARNPEFARTYASDPPSAAAVALDKLAGWLYSQMDVVAEPSIAGVSASAEPSPTPHIIALPAATVRTSHPDGQSIAAALPVKSQVPA